MHLRILHLVIPEAERLKLAVVRGDLLLELDNARVVFVSFVTLDKAAVKLDNSRKRELGAFGVVEATYSLNDLKESVLIESMGAYWTYHKSIVIWCRNGNRDESLANGLQHLADGLTSSRSIKLLS